MARTGLADAVLAAVRRRHLGRHRRDEYDRRPRGRLLADEARSSTWRRPASENRAPRGWSRVTAVIGGLTLFATSAPGQGQSADRRARPRSARDSGAADRGAARNAARGERPAGAHGPAGCHGDGRRHARHDAAPVGRATEGDAAHPFLLRRRTDAAGAGEREGPGNSVRARAGRHGQIPARAADVRSQV